MPTATFTPPKSYRPRISPAHADPFYGYGYNPNWPSILSVAHDESDGGRLFMIMDRPCALVDAFLPLEIVGTALTVVGAVMALPVKCHLTLNGAVAAGSMWRWPGNNTHIYDPKTGFGPNAGMGTVADFPGPYNPPGPATVLAAMALGNTCTLSFDEAMVLVGGPGPITPDDAIVFDNGSGPVAATSVQNVPGDWFTLQFTVPAPLSAGSTWAITRQPAWLTTGVVNPANGVF